MTVNTIQGFLTLTGQSSEASFQRTLHLGQQVTGRVMTINRDGNGTMRMPGGEQVNFRGAPNMQPGERVNLEVVRLQPEPTFRLVTSDSMQAAKLATDSQQSLSRAPDLFAKLLESSGLQKGNSTLARNTALLINAQTAGGRGVSLSDGRTMGQLLQQNLPNLELSSMMKGDAASLVKLLEGGSQKSLQEAILNLRQGAEMIRGEGRSEGDVTALRSAVMRTGDLLAMQDLLPRLPQLDPNNVLLGYRVFWLSEGGLGEAMVRREKERREGGEEEESTSMLLSLNMTQLGRVQARVVYRQGYLSVDLRAENSEALEALRQDVASLREGMHNQELPLKALELAMISHAELQAERARYLALGEDGVGFKTEA
uniref:TRAM domain-containing protein n=1 Tax=Magnetococcus massalia (strain MO-1) TaxID=451514 RepID=A0A1S7LLL4_MAGMO|nr:conserved protein of unknown function [Candidatus Magnetococcus massalia]